MNRGVRDGQTLVKITVTARLLGGPEEAGGLSVFRQNEQALGDGFISRPFLIYLNLESTTTALHRSVDMYMYTRICMRRTFERGRFLR